MLDGSPTPSKTRFERLCKEMGLTRCAFAERLGIPRSSYFHLMTEAANPSLEYIELIAERAGVEPIAFLGKVGQNTRRLGVGTR
jgi:transcriptional regulator with XRE-family HTH domain